MNSIDLLMLAGGFVLTTMLCLACGLGLMVWLSASPNLPRK
ncbi:hypothetical protein [Oleiharenicola lentus]